MKDDQPNHKLLDECYRMLTVESPAFDEAIGSLMGLLARLRAATPRTEWRRFAENARCSHPICEKLRQDPFTLRALEKPRGYAGDAKMIDFVYGYSEANHISETGKAILACTTNTATAQSVRHRRDTFAKAVDNTASETIPPRILALACGHLREAHLAEAVQKKRIGEYVAFDQDAKSLVVVKEEFSQFGVRTVQGSVLDLDFDSLGKFDLIYAAGLYDYLWRGAAKELTAYAFEMLNPGGKLMIANVLPDIPDAGYMEAIMDWWLVYRTPEQLESVADSIPPNEIASKRTFSDPLGNIVFLEIVRK